jgi:2-C-methyl-D-erythritol 4-phosphate cytidylyltransferase
MVVALIVAAGQGTRMGPGVDKLFLPVAGRPVVAHTWQRFEASPEIDQLVLVIKEAARGDFEKMASACGFRKPFQFVQGGKERQDSVWNGLMALPDAAEIVAIHDGARPCVDAAVIRDTVLAARESGAAVAAQRVVDTLKESEDGKFVVRTVDRSRLWAVQTPQAFRVGVIREALAQARERGLNLTDDTAACELIGQSVRLVTSDAPNPKVTSKGDLPWVEFLLARRR